MGTHAMVYFTTGTTIEAIVHHSSDGDTHGIQRDFVRFVASVNRGRQYCWDDPNLAASRWCMFHLLDLWVMQARHEEDSRLNWPSLHRPGATAVTPLEMMTVRIVNDDRAHSADYVHRIDFEHNGYNPPFIRSLQIKDDQPIPTKRHSFWSPMTKQEDVLPDLGGHHLLHPVKVDPTGLVTNKQASGLEPAIA